MIDSLIPMMQVRTERELGRVILIKDAIATDTYKKTTESDSDPYNSKPVLSVFFISE
jgi:hypothetical protein